MRPALVTRADAAFAGDPPADGGVHREGETIIGITCLCGAQVAGPIPLDGPGGQGTLVFGYWSNYQQAELTFDDGSKHVSHGCRDCWRNARDDTAEKFYVRDLIGFEALEALGHEGMSESLWARLLTRRPVGLKLVEAG